MSLGDVLQDKFFSLVNNNTQYKEVELFRKLIDAFLSMSHYFVEEIHGTKYQVTYKENNNWFNKVPRCELADMIIVAYSSERKEGRIVFIQNKLSKISPNNELRYRKIYANLVQYELLSERPIFSYVNKSLNYAEDIFYGSEYESICQYGLFYQNTDGTINMSCITASEFGHDLGSKKLVPITTKNPCTNILFDKEFETFNSRAKKGDFIAAQNLKDFGDLLEDLYIGRPIDGSLKKEILEILREQQNINTTNRILEDFSEIDFDGSDLERSSEEISVIKKSLLSSRVLLMVDVDYMETPLIRDLE